MIITPKSISIENFKSIKKLSIDLSPLTLLIGPNGSGKSSIIEAIKLAFEAVNYHDPSDNPFMQYWGFTNVVTDQDPDQLISISFKFDVEKYDVEYGLKVTGIGGNFKFVEEYIKIFKYMEIRRIGRIVKVNYDDDYFAFIEKNKDNIKKKLEIFFHPYRNKLDIVKNKDEIGEIDESISILHLDFFRYFPILSERNNIKLDSYNMNIKYVRDPKNANNIKLMLIPGFTFRNPDKEGESEYAGFRRMLVSDVVEAIRSFFITQYDYPNRVSTWDIPRKVIFLKHDYIYQMKQSVPINLQMSKNIGGKEALIWLFKKFNGEGGKIPERIASAIDSLFPGWSVQFKITDDGNVILLVRRLDESGKILSLLPVSLPDGFFKLLLIMIFLEMKPSILLIDELENSLHYKIVGYIMDSLRESGIPVIMTSHSPLVIDQAKLSEVRVLTNENGQTKIKKVSNRKNLAEKLLKEGLTPSDYYLYS